MFSEMYIIICICSLMCILICKLGLVGSRFLYSDEFFIFVLLILVIFFISKSYIVFSFDEFYIF